MAKLFSHQVPLGTDAEGSSATPAQFLPSMLLSWRAPIMARDGLRGKSRSEPFQDSRIAIAKDSTRSAT